MYAKLDGGGTVTMYDAALGASMVQRDQVHVAAAATVTVQGTGLPGSEQQTDSTSPSRTSVFAGVRTSSG